MGPWSKPVLRVVFGVFIYFIIIIFLYVTFIVLSKRSEDDLYVTGQ